MKATPENGRVAIQDDDGQDLCALDPHDAHEFGAALIKAALEAIKMLQQNQKCDTKRDSL